MVVQRETWTIDLEELGAGDFTGISRDLVTAVERLRAARQLPRHVYIRPSEQALRRSGAKAATRTPSRFTSILRAISSWKFFTAG